MQFSNQMLYFLIFFVLLVYTVICNNLQEQYRIYNNIQLLQFLSVTINVHRLEIIPMEKTVLSKCIIIRYDRRRTTRLQTISFAICNSGFLLCSNTGRHRPPVSHHASWFNVHSVNTGKQDRISFRVSRPCQLGGDVLLKKHVVCRVMIIVCWLTSVIASDERELSISYPMSPAIPRTFTVSFSFSPFFYIK